MINTLESEDHTLFECDEITGIAHFGDDDMFGIGAKDSSGETLTLRVGRDLAEELIAALEDALASNEVHQPDQLKHDVEI
jgi:hypothetical protein